MANISDTLRAACVVPSGTARASAAGIAAGAARIVVVRVRKRVKTRVGKRILVEGEGRLSTEMDLWYERLVGHLFSSRVGYFWIV